MTEYWPCLLAAVCAIAVLRCAARQRHGMRSLLAGAVCGLGALALLGLLEPVTGIALPLNRFTAFCAGVLYAAETDLPLPEALKLGACCAAASLSEVSASDGVKTKDEVLRLYDLYGRG